MIHSPFHYVKGQTEAAVILAFRMNIKEAGTQRRAIFKNPMGIKVTEEEGEIK